MRERCVLTPVLCAIFKVRDVFLCAFLYNQNICCVFYLLFTQSFTISIIVLVAKIVTIKKVCEFW